MAFLFMSYIEGSPIDIKLWRSFTDAQQSSILHSLKIIIQKLRGIPVPPSTRIGGILGTSARLAYPSCESQVPSFETEASMHSWLIGAISSFCVFPPLIDGLRSAPTSDKLVFTHGDIASRNLIVRDGKLVGLVDWEWSGWYPEHFETVRAEIEIARKRGELPGEVRKLLPDYPRDRVDIQVEFHDIVD